MKVRVILGDAVGWLCEDGWESVGLLRDADVKVGMDNGIGGAEGSFARVGIGLIGFATEVRFRTSVSGPGFVDFVGSDENPRVRSLPSLTGLL